MSSPIGKRGSKKKKRRNTIDLSNPNSPTVNRSRRAFSVGQRPDADVVRNRDAGDAPTPDRGVDATPRVDVNIVRNRQDEGPDLAIRRTRAQSIDSIRRDRALSDLASSDQGPAADDIPLATERNRRRRRASLVQRQRDRPAVVDRFRVEAIARQAAAAIQLDYDSAQAPDLATKQNLDPFGIIRRAPNSPLGNYDFNALSANKGADFLSKISITRDGAAPARNMPAPVTLANARLIPAALSNGIPALQHSVWVGNPLNADIPKQKAFMEALARNKRDNPSWRVVLWTDQTRATMNNAAPDSLEGKMRQWAADNNIILANIDEVFAGNNKMSLNDIANLERNKGGTGRAAASDIVRLEVLNRFGGMYVDGDKAINVPIDDITAAANSNRIRLIVPADQTAGETIVDPKTDAEQQAVANGQRVIQVQGFAAGNAYGSYQNCALCARKNSPATRQILARITDNYTQNRAQLDNNGQPVGSQARPQRAEVIVRTGPSVVRDTLDPNSKQGSPAIALMPLNSVNTYTGTTSWSGEKAFTAAQNSADFAGQIRTLPAAGALHAQANTAATLPTNLPDDAALTPQRSAAILSVVKKGLTTLSYTVANEVGRLDLNYLKPHLAGLSPAEQQLAVHAVLQSLAQPQFSGLASSITTLRLPTLRSPNPSDLALSLETLDLLNSDAFSNLKLDTFSIQDAAIEGNLSFLRYAVERGLLTDFNQSASQLIDAGYLTNPMLASLPHVSGGATVVSKRFDVVQAAIMGGDRNTIQYLSSLTAFRNYNSLDTVLGLAAKYGQVDTVIALAEAHNRPNSIVALVNASPINVGIEILQRYKAAFPNSADLNNASAPLIEKAIAANQLDLLPRLLALGVDINHAVGKQRASIVSALRRRAVDGQSSTAILAAVRSIDDTKQLENELLLQAAANNNTELILIKLNERRNPNDQKPFGAHDGEAALSVAHLRFPNSELGKNDYRGVQANTLQVSQARELVQKALVYAHDRLRTDNKGASGRVNGWRNLLNQMQNQPSLSSLNDLINQTLVQLNGMNSDNSVQLNQLRQTAKNTVNDFPLSQREITSVSGKIGQFFRTTVDTNPVIVRTGRFVPGKGYIPAPLYDI